MPLLLLAEDEFALLTEDEFALFLEQNMAAITRLVPLPRSSGIQVPNAWPAASWCDSLIVAGAAESYTIKSDADGNRSAILRLCASAVIYYDFNSTAVVPIADTTTGGSAVMLPANTPRILVFPNAADTLSIIGTATVTIEAWS